MADSKNPVLLLVDDDKHGLNALRELFTDDYEVVAVSSGVEAIEAVKSNSMIAVVILDIKMAGMDGITAGRHIREHNDSINIIFHTGYPGDYEENEIDKAEKPYDFVVKGRSASRLIRSVRNAFEAYQLKNGDSDLAAVAESRYGLFGRSRAMQAVYRLIKKVAAADNKVVILGETGTGKEVVARAIHANSRRQHGRLGIVNCNHKSTELVEAELFGYKKGAFTGAVVDRKGLFEVADGGTVFLDEIGDLSATTQIALLRVLETGEFQQIGPESDLKSTDVRILCATHRNLEAMVSEDRFRQDLYYRLKGSTIVLPPLRDRREDIPLLTEKFRDDATIGQGLPYKALSPDAISALIEYDWPGNVRQLKDTVESLVVLTDSDLIVGTDVRTQLQSGENCIDSTSRGLSKQLRELERSLIVQALAEASYNISAAASLLQVERSNLSKKIKQHGIDVAQFRNEFR